MLLTFIASRCSRQKEPDSTCMHTNPFIFIFIIVVSVSTQLLYVYVYIWTHVCILTYVCIYIYLSIQTHTYRHKCMLVFLPVIQHHKIHYSLALLLIRNFSDREKSGSHYSPSIRLFVQPQYVWEVVSELLTHTSMKNKLTDYNVYVLFILP